MTTSTGSASQMNVVGLGVATASNYHGGIAPLGTLEFGAKIRNAHKSQNAIGNRLRRLEAPTSYPMTQLLDPFNSTNYYNNELLRRPLRSGLQLQQRRRLHADRIWRAFVDGYKTAANTYPNMFDLTERICAGYAMNTIDLRTGCACRPACASRRRR